MATLVYTPLDQIQEDHNALRKGFSSGKFKSIAYRKYQLLQLAYLLHDNAKRFEEAFKADLGRPPYESYSLEINTSIGDVKKAWSNVENWAKPEKLPFNIQWAAFCPTIRKEPKGVVLIIGPFNYPLWSNITPLAGAIAAGCATLIKPSERTPAVCSLLAELIPKYMDPDLVRVVNGGIPEATKVLSLQWDHILYIGSGRVGKIVSAAAAKFLTPVTLELGGKSPVFVDENCDLEVAARRILWGKVVNAGQTCVGPDYILVPRLFQDKFIEALKDAYTNFYPDSPSAPGATSRIISPQAFTRLKALLNNTKGTIAIGGEMDEKTKYMAPTIVKDVLVDDALMSEEIFGPILPIVPVDSLDEAIAYVNAHDHPLALYIFSKDGAFKSKVLDNTQSGGVSVNDCLLHSAVDGLPFGGIGASGMGFHTGKFSFDLFTHMRSAIDSPSWIDKLFGFRFPPYTDAKMKASNRSIPKLPPRPKGPPSPAEVTKNSKWYLNSLLLVALTAVGLSTRTKISSMVLVLVSDVLGKK